MKLLIARPMIAAVEARAHAEFDVDFRRNTQPWSMDEMLRALTGFDVVAQRWATSFQSK